MGFHEKPYSVKGQRGGLGQLGWANAPYSATTFPSAIRVRQPKVARCSMGSVQGGSCHLRLGLPPIAADIPHPPAVAGNKRGVARHTFVTLASAFGTLRALSG